MLLTAKQLITQSWTLYKTHVSQLFQILGYYAITTSVLTFATIVITLKPALAIPAFILALLSLIMLMYVNVVLTLACWNIINNQTLNWNSLYSSSYKKLGRSILIAFITALIVMGGFILLIIPGFIFAIWYQFSYLNQITSDEKLTISKALTDSKVLVVGRWWQTAWRTIAPQIVFGLIVGLLGGVIAGIIPGSTTDYTNLTGIVAENLASIILSSITAPLLLFPMLLLYKSLKETKVATVDKI